MLAAASDPRNADEIVLGENGVVVGQERRSLPGRQSLRQKGGGGVEAAVEAETDGGGAGIVSVLNQLFEHGGALRVVE